MTKQVLIFIALALMAILALSACAPAATPAPTAAPATSAPAPTNPPPPTSAPAATTAPTSAPTGGKALKVGVVLDTGGPTDKSFNQSAVEGLNKAIADLKLDPASKFLQSNQQSDYDKNIQEFIQQGYDAIEGNGFLLGVNIGKAAKANPNVKFAIVDYAYPDCAQGQTEGKDCASAQPLPNALGLLSKVEEATFLAGYVSAGVSKTKVVGTFGGLNFSAVTDFEVGYEAGVKYWNQKHNDKVKLVGWSTAKNEGTFAAGSNPFNDPDKGKQITLSLIDEGADIVLPVAGGTGLGTFAAAKDKKILAIGVDADQCLTVPDACPILLTSIVKKVGVAVYNFIKQAQDGTYKGGVFFNTLANGGVDLAPFHDNDSKVPDAIKTELAQVKADIIAGKIDIRAIAKGP
jgi:basic membrane protein A